MYLLKFVQWDRTVNVGVFDTEKDIYDFLSVMPYFEKTVDTYEGSEFTNYTLKKEELPIYDEIEFNNHIYILTKYMFNEDDIVDVEWERIQNFSIKNETSELAIGSTRVDAYVVENAEVKTYIEQREELAEKLLAEFDRRGIKAERTFRDSEDGEAVCAYNEDGSLYSMIYLDPSAINGMKLGKLDEMIDGEYNYDWTSDEDY